VQPLRLHQRLKPLPLPQRLHRLLLPPLRLQRPPQKRLLLSPTRVTPRG